MNSHCFCSSSTVAATTRQGMWRPTTQQPSSPSSSPSSLPSSPWVRSRRALLLLPSFRISSSLLPRRRRNPRHRWRTNPSKPSSPSTSSDDNNNNNNIELSLDINNAFDLASASLRRFYRKSESYLYRFLSSGAEACHDLSTSVRIDDSRRIVFSCRRSSLLFVANVLFWGMALLLSARAFLSFLAGFRPLSGFGNSSVFRRDRSLGGKEVVVGRRNRQSTGREVEWRRSGMTFRSPNPLSLDRVTGTTTNTENVPVKHVTRQERLPDWWPVLVSSPSVSAADKEYYQREANMLVRAIMDNRMSGRDYNEDDIVQLRQICRTSGARVSFDTENTRDSFYRSSIDFILNVCSRAAQPITHVQIDGEGVRQFLAGLADNIGLENNRAAIFLHAAVAAKTRLWFLQAWALEVQGKHVEALIELSKISLIHHTFPPEDQSPEIEMVASGLKKNLNVEQRKLLLNMFGEASGAESNKTAAAALGLPSQ